MRVVSVQAERLSASSGLLYPPRTRWLYIFYAFDRLLSLKDPVSDLVSNNYPRLGACELSTTEWRKIKSLRDLLDKFAKYTVQLEGEFYVTSSRVIPSLMDLKDFCEMSIHGEKITNLGAFAQSIQYFFQLAPPRSVLVELRGRLLEEIRYFILP